MFPRPLFMKSRSPQYTARRAIGSANHRRDTISLQLAEIEDLARRALIRAGASCEHADAVADVVMRAEQGKCATEF